MMSVLLIGCAVYGSVTAVLVAAAIIWDRIAVRRDPLERIWGLRPAEDRDPRVDWQGFETQARHLRSLPTVEPRRQRTAR